MYTYTLSFSAHSNASNLEAFEWLHDDVLVETDEISSGGHLLIQAPSLDQAGSYACRGRFNNGEYTDPVSAGELVVLGERCNVQYMGL